MLPRRSTGSAGRGLLPRRRGRRRGHYTEQAKAEALALYEQLGPAEAARRTMIPEGTIKTWAFRTGAKPVSLVDNAQAAREALRLKREATRERVRTKLLDTAEWSLDRVQHEHVEFAGRDGVRRVHNVAPSGAVRDYAVAVASLLKELRTEMGESAPPTTIHTTSRTTSVSAELRLTDVIRDDAERAYLHQLAVAELARRTSEPDGDERSGDAG